MAVSPESAKTILSEWVGLTLSEEEVEALRAGYENLHRGLAAFPDEKLRWVEPALHSVPAFFQKEAER